MAYEDVRLEIRLWAIEQTIRLLFANLLKSHGCSVDQANSAIESIISQAAAETTPEAHPVQSDMIAAEYEEAMRALLRDVPRMLAREGGQG